MMQFWENLGGGGGVCEIVTCVDEILQMQKGVHVSSLGIIQKQTPHFNLLFLVYLLCS